MPINNNINSLLSAPSYATWFTQHIDVLGIGFLTGVLGLGKIASSMGLSIFNASLDDEYISLSENATLVTNYLLLGGSALVAGASRLPRIYAGLHKLLQRVRGIKTSENVVLPSPEPYSWRWAGFWTSYFWFVVCGSASLIFVTLAALNSGEFLVNELENHTPQAKPDWINYVFGIFYSPICAFLSWMFFNLLRLIPNARQSAYFLSHLGVNEVEQFTPREKKALAATVVIAGLYAVGNAANCVITTEKSILSLQRNFLNSEDKDPNEVDTNIAYYSAIFPFATVMLTCGVDMYNLLCGRVRIFPEQKNKKIYAALTILIIASLLDTILGNAAGFYGSSMQILQRLSIDPAKWFAKSLASLFAIVSLIPYFSNNGLHALQILLPKTVPSLPEAMETSQDDSILTTTAPTPTLGCITPPTGLQVKLLDSYDEENPKQMITRKRSQSLPDTIATYNRFSLFSEYEGGYGVPTHFEFFAAPAGLNRGRRASATH